MQLHYFPIASYVLAQYVHYCPEDFAGTITLDPLKFVCGARLHISNALNLVSNYLIIITHASLLQTLNCASIVESKFWLHSKYQVQKLIWVQKWDHLDPAGVIWIPLSSQEQTLKWKDVLQIYAFPYFPIPCNKNHVHSPAETDRIFWSDLKKKP